MVHFVGAGSGGPDLITVRGQKLLTEADMIIYAGSLVNPALLENAGPGCEIYDSARLHLDEVIGLMKRAHEEGKTVVRLHTGDPSVYGAIREQMDRLEEAGISYDVCPGVSSFCGAAAVLKKEYTLPGVSQTLILTRMEGRTPVPERERIRSLASHGASMAVFLSASMLGKLRDELIAGGVYTEDTPCAIVYKATWPDEKRIITRLADLADEAEKAGISKTALILVGDFLGNEYELSKLYDPGFSTEFRQALKPEGRRVMRTAVITFTERGLAGAKKIAGVLERTEKITASARIYKFRKIEEDSMEKTGSGDLGTDKAGPAIIEFSDTSLLVKELFENKDLIIFIGAAGIAIRHIAPFINSKVSDPAVLVADEELRNIVPILSGHIGGANTAALEISKMTGSQPVVTTASDVQGMKAVDTVATEKGFRILDMKAARRATSAILRGASLEICHEKHDSEEDDRFYFQAGGEKLPVHFLPYVVGLGCKKGTHAEKMKSFISQELSAAGVDPGDVWKIASIDLKKDEPALLEAASELDLPFYVFSPDQLKEVRGQFTPSEFVSKVTGVDNVCERSAAAGCGAGYELILTKQAYDGMTIAIAKRQYEEVMKNE